MANASNSKVYAVLSAMAEAMQANKAMLTELDAAIGDADHGNNMSRGFAAAMARLTPEMEIGQALKTTAMTLISTVGGAAGPLYGTAFLRAAQAVDGKEQVGAAEVLAALEAALEGIRQRGGGTQVGDKTMVDSLEPAVAAFRQAVAAGKSTAECFAAARDAAEEGMKSTIPLVARKGRASYLGERSKGHQDPGATSSYLLLKAAADALAGNGEG